MFTTRNDLLVVGTSTLWSAGDAGGRKLLEEAGIPAYRTPEIAVDLFYHMSKYFRNQKLLLQTPEPTRQHDRPEAEGAKMLIEALLAERRKVLSEMESKAILRAFRVPVAQTMVARTATEALLLAEQIGFPVAMKVDSPDLQHKSEVGGGAPQHHERRPSAMPITTSSTPSRSASRKPGSTAFRSSPSCRARTPAK